MRPRRQSVYQLRALTPRPRSAGVALGLKLPTGSFTVTNSEGVAAERMLQPGTGTTDARQVYAYVQLPLYQYVNGVQLTANWAALAGVSWRF